jgi:hypothetical protein
MSTMTLPSEPVRVSHDWQNAKMSNCAQCGAWKQCVPIDGDYTCAGCIDGNRTAEWQDYARQLRSMLDDHLRREVKVPDGEIIVAAEDANNYCRILTILGMEEEGDPVAWVESRKSLENGRSDGWMAESRADGYVIISPSGDSTFVQDSSMRISDEILRQLAQDLLSAAAPTKGRRVGDG